MPAENPVETVMRLLEKNIEVRKDDGSRAAIYVGKEWYDRELFTNYDGQITVDLAESRETKLEISGHLRRRLGTLRVNVWAAERLMRDKIVEEVIRVVREHCTNPCDVAYDFKYATRGGDSRAYEAIGGEPAPTSGEWAELSNVDYEKIWASDDVRLYKSHRVAGEYPCFMFKFKIENKREVVKKIVLLYEGYGLAYAGNGITIKAWNHVAEAWQLTATGTWLQDQEVKITIEENISDFIDDDGYVYLFARTTNPGTDTNSAALYCDYVSCALTVDGITFLDVDFYRSADRVDVKPFIFCKEFRLKSWLFERVTT